MISFFNEVINNASLASWIQAIIYFVTLLVLMSQLKALQKQTKNQSEALNLQTKSLRESEYLRCQIDYTETMRLLIQSGQHSKVYDDLAKNADSSFINWDSYTPEQKNTYSYMEMIYELFERVYCISKEGWIPQTEWIHWEKWVEDVIKHPLFSDVHKDNLGMYDTDFEQYLSGKIKTNLEKANAQQKI